MHLYLTDSLSLSRTSRTNFQNALQHKKVCHRQALVQRKSSLPVHFRPFPVIFRHFTAGEGAAAGGAAASAIAVGGLRWWRSVRQRVG